MGEALQNYGDFDNHVAFQAQIAEYKAGQINDGLIPQQRQVSEEIMAIGRASRAAFMRPQVEAGMRAQKLAEAMQQHEEQQALAAKALANGEAKWYELAKCKGSDAEFFPEGFTEETLKRMARAACSGCFVKDQCLEDELAQGRNDQHGIRGGTTPRERRAMLDKQLNVAS